VKERDTISLHKPSNDNSQICHTGIRINASLSKIMKNSLQTVRYSHCTTVNSFLRPERFIARRVRTYEKALCIFIGVRIRHAVRFTFENYQSNTEHISISDLKFDCFITVHHAFLLSETLSQENL
jgi:hypothetical protein